MHFFTCYLHIVQTIKFQILHYSFRLSLSSYLSLEIKFTWIIQTSTMCYYLIFLSKLSCFNDADHTVMHFYICSRMIYFFNSNASFLISSIFNVSLCQFKFTNHKFSLSECPTLDTGSIFLHSWDVITFCVLCTLSDPMTTIRLICLQLSETRGGFV